MSTVRTLKQGHMHVLAGDTAPLCLDTDAQFPCGFVASDGTHVLLYKHAGNIERVSGNSFLTLGTGAGSVVIDETQEVGRPVVYVDGVNVHLWYAYDSAGGSAFSVYYAKSTDAGVNWTAGVEVIPIGAGGTWNDVSVVPIGAHDDGTNLVLHVEGDPGPATQLGMFTATSGVDYAVPGNYSAHGSNPLTGYQSPGFYAVVHHRGSYHCYHAHSSTWLETVVSSSVDGVTWPHSKISEGKSVLPLGSTGALDDAYSIPHAGWSDGRLLWLFSKGNDGAASYVVAAVGEDAEALYKVPGFRIISLPAEIPYCSGDLSYQEADESQHIDDRMGPGALTLAPFEPFEGSFGYRMSAMPSEYVTPDPGVNSDGQTVNLLYLMDGDTGSSEQWVLFPRSLVSTDFSEEEDGNLVSISFTCYGTSLPVRGEF